eukprot:CAMPEP_0197859912 /NCGR_PEP_ID=MMETSP1438-20131217/34909_1 /TAXON_ID=1461541 /ORGANISM="Pterosperma sp., Strain CCMP1384" /LENGTH=63 /DNA_ID=CAMNT_0043476591 /DNA_START=41 /DNA_END=227 /DNA_ORIENTATION=+
MTLENGPVLSMLMPPVPDVMVSAPVPADPASTDTPPTELLATMLIASTLSKLLCSTMLPSATA